MLEKRLYNISILTFHKKFLPTLVEGLGRVGEAIGITHSFSVKASPIVFKTM